MIVHLLRACILAVILVLFLVDGPPSALAQQPAPAGEQAKPLVEGVLARAEAVFSGRILYRLKAGFADTGQMSYPESRIQFSFSGESWAVTYLGERGGKTVSRPGIWIQHVLHPQPDGRVDHTAGVAHYEPVDKHRPCPPFFAGTFWYRSTVEFLRAHVGEARLVGDGEVHGVPTRILEVAVPAKEGGKAFQGMAKADRLWKPGTLRFHVAPQLGFVVPRVENISSINGGELDSATEAEQFFDVGKGIFFPKKLKYQSYLEPDHPTHYVEYMIEKTEKINEEIDEADFTVVLPKGTSVHDGRDPKNAVSFRVGQFANIPKDLEQVISSKPPPAPRRYWLQALLIGGGIGALALVSIFLVRHRLRRRHALP